MRDVEIAAAASSSNFPPLAPLSNGTLPRAKRRGTPTTTPLSSNTNSRTKAGTPDSTTTTTTHTTTCSIPSRSFIRSCQKAKRCRFFRNGDQYFKGIWFAISPERFRCIEALIEDLTRALGDLIYLPTGVRQIFTIDGGAKVTELTEFTDGHSYVCASNDAFKKVDYENAREPMWCYSSTSKYNRLDDPMLRYGSTVPSVIPEPNEFVHPRIITVIRNGNKPRKVIRLLLNKRTAHSFDQVLSDIAGSIKLNSGMVRRVFTLQGQQVSCLADFFKEESIFVAYGSERLTGDDFYLDSEEAKFLYSPRLRSGAALSKSCIRIRYRHNVQASPLIRKKFLNLQHKNQKKLGHKRKAEHTDSNKSAKSTPTDESNSLIDERLEIVTDDVENNQENELDFEHPLEIQDRFSFVRLIGDGNFANVYECNDRVRKFGIALKVIDKSRCSGKEEMVENEVQLMRRLSHKYIVKLYDDWNTEFMYYLSMELVQGGDLFDALVQIRQYSEPVSAGLMKSLVEALVYLHSMNIVHRDVKPENLLLYADSDGKCFLKLADFGLATETNEVLYTVCGTPTYVAPEMLAEIGYGREVDIWAAGVILYITLCGFPPFVSLSDDQEELFASILSGQFAFPFPYWQNVSPAAKCLIQNMLHLSAEDRMTAEDVLRYPWIENESYCANGFPYSDPSVSTTVMSDDIMNQLTTSCTHRMPSDFERAKLMLGRGMSMEELTQNRNSETIWDNGIKEWSGCYSNNHSVNITPLESDHSLDDFNQLEMALKTELSA